MMIFKKTSVSALLLFALGMSLSSAHADNIFTRLFKPKNKKEETTPLPPDSFDVQAQPGIKLDSKGKKVETRSYLTPSVIKQLGSAKKSTSKSGATKVNNDAVSPDNSPLNVDTENGAISYDPTDGIRQQIADKVNYLKEQAGNSAYFNSLYSSAIFTYAMRKPYFKAADGTFKNLEQSIITDNLSDPSKFKLELNDLQLAFFNSMVSFVSENPAILGGKPMRGFEPKIWNALVQVLLSNTIPMTPDGILLLPYNEEYEFRFADYKADNGTMIKSTLVLVDRRGNLLDESGRPIIPKSFKTLGEPDKGEGALPGEYVDSVQDWTFMDQLQQVAPTLVSAFTGRALFIQNKPQFDSFLRSQAVFTESMSFVDCFKLWLNQQNPDIRVADCFKQGGSALGTELHAWITDGSKTFGRGAVAGALLSKGFMGINAAAGALYGGLSNVFGFMYNRYLRKEHISPTQIQNLISFISSHTFKQGQWGMIQPGTDKGLWGVTHTGLITRYRTMTLRDYVGRNGDGTPQYALKDKNVRLDLNGDPLTGTSTVQFKEVFNPDNIYKIRKAAAQMDKSGGENGLAGMADAQLQNPDHPMSVADANTFMKENSLRWVADPKDAVKAADSPSEANDKLMKNVNAEVQVDSVKPEQSAPSAATKQTPAIEPVTTSSTSTPLAPTNSEATNKVMDNPATLLVPSIKIPPQN